SEILTRQIRHVDLVNGWLRLDPNQTKNGDGRMFPFDIPNLDFELRDILTDQIERNHAYERATGRIVPWLFHREGKPIKNFYGSWRTACELAGYSGKRKDGKVPHDFRRTAVRNLVRAGVPEVIAMKLTGHLTPSIFKRYAIVDANMLRDGVAKLAAFL